MINDALDVPNHKVWKYVDDLTIGENRAYGEASTVQDSLDSLSTWADENKLRLNPAKCQALQVYFGRREVPEVDLHISNHQLAVVDKVKLLGAMIQNDLKWDSQVDSMCTKANRKMFMMRSLKEAGFSPSELLTVYKGYMRPVLEYAAPLWHAGLTQSQVNQVENIQKRVCKHIQGREYISYSKSLADLELDPLCKKKEKICRDFATKTTTSERFSTWFPPAEYRSVMTLRNMRKYKNFKCKTKRFQDSPMPYMADLLNK
ncbi:uncharacterized protein [Amphiura filiformis]|uniref:uncharacterized protein n=1 Tax=Amphiura filiformis TaxID=82378 RepID=UPI003B217848